MDWLLDAQRRSAAPVPGSVPPVSASGRSLSSPAPRAAGESPAMPRRASQARAGDDQVAMPCPLCGSSAHTYSMRRGYTHEGPITVPCTQPGPDGKPCGLLHAYRGPLRTPCRA
eukprot:803941-Pyramimonas_sp.AAC.4